MMVDIAINAKRQVADATACVEAKAVIERWNEQLAASRDPGCAGRARAIDLRNVDRHPLASVATLVLGLRCSWCPESAPMPRILGLHALPPVAKTAASNL
jgi:hypothetical protein